MAIGAIIGKVLTGLGAAAGATSLVDPLGRWKSQELNSAWPNNLPDISTILNSYFRGLIPDREYYELLKKLGYDKRASDAFKLAGRPILSAYEYITLFRRGQLSFEKLSVKLDEVGIERELQELLIKATEYFPSAPDLVRFAIREVYNPAIVEKFGLKDEIPSKFLDESFKAGLPVEQAENFWAAHWDLPSPLMGFEMLHRRIIGEEDLKLLLKALDVMPYWRDKLIQLSYRPLTRVDVRRMYRLGVLDVKQVRSSYLDLGYSPNNADLMTQFTVEYETEGLSDLTKSQIITAYKKNIISNEDMISFLSSLGMSNQVLRFWIDTAQYEKTLLEVDKYKQELQEIYLNGGLDLDNVRQKLLEKDLPPDFVRSVLDDFQTLQGLKAKIPNISTITRWVESELIDDVQYSNYMSKLGYKRQEILLFLSELHTDKPPAKRRLLKDTIYIGWFKQEIITKQDLHDIFILKGYSEQDIFNLFQDIGGTDGN